MSIEKLNENDYLLKDKDFWQDYRIKLTNELKNNNNKLEKNPKNIYEMAKNVGVKPTARYFNIQPSQVRYFIKKQEKENEKL